MDKVLLDSATEMQSQNMQYHKPGFKIFFSPVPTHVRMDFVVSPSPGYGRSVTDI
jgi:hypothetical protein